MVLSAVGGISFAGLTSGGNQSSVDTATVITNANENITKGEAAAPAYLTASHEDILTVYTVQFCAAKQGTKTAGDKILYEKGTEFIYYSTDEIAEGVPETEGFTPVVWLTPVGNWSPEFLIDMQ